MKKEDLDALSGLYESVYSPNSGEYLQEELELLIERGAPTDPKARAAYNAQVAKNRSALGNTLLYGNAAGRKPSTLSTPRNVRGGGTRKPATAPEARPATAPAARPATAPAARPATAPAARPATPGSGAKVAPTASKATTPAKPAGSAMDQWAAANPKLAAAKAERDRTRGTSATTNPLMKDMKSRMPAPKAPSPSTSSTAFANKTPALGSSSSEVKSSGSTSAAKPTTNQTVRAFSSPSVRPTPSTTPIKKPGAVMSSFEWPSIKTIKDIAGAYASIYEAKKKDQDQDGDNDFADVRIARMIASGMSKAEAIAAVKNKPYNEEVEIDEATLSAKAARAGKDIGAKGKNFAKIAASAGERYGSAEAGKRVAGAILKKMRANEEFELDEATRMRKELGKEGETATRKELAARSKAYKRSGSVDKTIAAAERAADWSGDEKKAKALRGLASSRRGSVRDKPRAGMRGYAAKVEGGDKDLQTSRQKAMSAGTLTPKEKKQLGEVYEIVASYLLENNFAETLNDANVIIENMSEVWLSQILESAE